MYGSDYYNQPQGPIAFGPPSATFYNTASYGNLDLLDPYTTYQYAGNKPIRLIDIEGLEEGDGAKDASPDICGFWRKRFG
jgi:hypothetical protein